MLLVSTTDPLPAHRPWSGGSMSPRGFVASEALSTALRPFTPVAPPAEVLMLSQPAPSGWHLTVGITGVGAAAASAWAAPKPKDAGARLPVVGRRHRVRTRTTRLRLSGWPPQGSMMRQTRSRPW